MYGTMPRHPGRRPPARIYLGNRREYWTPAVTGGERVETVDDMDDVIVIGGGIVGASAAYRMARSGARVTVVDRADPGQATAAGAGIISPGTSYHPPADACRTYRLCYDALAQFEADLHQHVHLENHVLFPRAVALESALG